MVKIYTKNISKIFLNYLGFNDKNSTIFYLTFHRKLPQYKYHDFEKNCKPPKYSFFKRFNFLVILLCSLYLADPGKARGCFTNTLVINSLTESLFT